MAALRHRVGNFVCEICGARFTIKRSLTRHNNHCYNGEPGKNDKIQ